MSLVRVVVPESETHLVLIVGALEAAEIPYFVHNANIGGLMPGLLIPSYNARAVMVPQSCADDAVAVIGELQLQPPQPLPVGAKWRIFAEALLLGWFLPASRRHQATSEDAE